jgi:hypothetical protein
MSLKTLEANRVKFQALWYSAFIILYVWFLFWVCNDLFVWHKTIFQVNVVNYVGSIVSIAFIWAGTKVWKPKRMETRKQQKERSKQSPVSKSECAHYLGYLHQRQRTKEIPAECIACTNLIQCFSSAKQ